MKIKNFSKFSLLATGLFLLFAAMHCFIFRPGIFYNRYIYFFSLYVLFYVLLLLIVLTLVTKLNTVKKIFLASLICPYILAGTMGFVFYVFNPSNLDELFAFTFYWVYIAMGCYLGTIPFFITCLLYKRNEMNSV